MFQYEDIILGEGKFLVKGHGFINQYNHSPKLLKSDIIKGHVNELEQKYREKLEIAQWLNRKLVSNQGNKGVAFLNWFSLKESFSYDLVVKLIRLANSKPQGTFLDPFSGAGTSIFAAASYGMKSIGIELLPIGQFLHETRLAAILVNIADFEENIFEVLKYTKSNRSPGEQFLFRHIPITAGAFPQDTEKSISRFLEFAEGVNDEYVRQLLKFACFSVLEKVSYTSKDGQYLRWDIRSGRIRAGNYTKAKIYNFIDAVSNTLTSMLSAIKGRDLFFRNVQTISENTMLLNGSALEKLPGIPSETIDLIISSPPYCNRYDYTRTYALELAFLGIGNEKVKELRQGLLSCTVENKSKEQWLRSFYHSIGRVDTYESAKRTFDSNGALKSILNALKRSMEKKELNNPGIYRMVYNYFFEHSFVIHEMARVLKQGGKIFYINDNVRYDGVSIPVDFILSDFAESAGLSVTKIYYLKRGKGNSSQQMGKHGREELRKCVYLWEKKEVDQMIGYSSHLRGPEGLVSTYEEQRAGFLALALEKNKMSTPFIDEAKVLRQAASAATHPRDLLNIDSIQHSFLKAAGISDKAEKFLTQEDKRNAKINLIEKFLEPAGPQFVDELVYRFLLIQGDALGGMIRNIGGKMAKIRFIDLLRASLRSSGIKAEVMLRKANNWLADEPNYVSSESIKAMRWLITRNHNTPNNQEDRRTLVLDYTPKFIKKNVDACLLKGYFNTFTDDTLASPSSYLALGELKGGIDPAGADEHWKTGNTALQRIRDAFNQKGYRPLTFFVGAAIEKSMAEEIWNQLTSGTLSNAANLTKASHMEALCLWMISL